MDVRLFYFHVTLCTFHLRPVSKVLVIKSLKKPQIASQIFDFQLTCVGLLTVVMTQTNKLQNFLLASKIRIC